MPPSPSPLFVLVLHRRRASWRTQAVIAAGVLVAAVLMAATAIYPRAVADLSLTETLRAGLGSEASAVTSRPPLPLASPARATTAEFVEGTLDARLGELQAGVDRATILPPIGLEAPSVPENSRPYLGILLALENAFEHVEASGARPAVSEAGPAEAWVEARVAQARGIEIGDTLTLTDRFDECDREPPPALGAPPPPPALPCEPRLAVINRVPVRITGFYSLDREDPFWSRIPAIARDFFEGDPVSAFIPLLTTHAQIERLGRGALPGYRASALWFSRLDTEGLDSAHLTATQANLDLLHEDMGTVGGAFVSPLEAELDDFERRLDFSRIPTLLLLAQVAGIVFVYIALVGALLIEARAPELAMLRNRGASLAQVLGLAVLEGAVLAIAAAIVAPWIAVRVISALGLTGPFEPLTDGDFIPTVMTAESWALAGAGALVALVFAAGPAVAVSQRLGAAERQAEARPPRANLLQRYYLDVALGLLAVALIAEADLRGSVFTRDSVGGLSADPLLLTTPALFAIVGVLIVMRLLPLGFRALSRAGGARLPLPLMLTLRHLLGARGAAVRLTLLLMVAAGLGTFAASYAETVNRSLEERVRFQEGVDLHGSVRDPRNPNDPAALARHFRSAPGVHAAAATLRANVAAGQNVAAAATVLLGVMPDQAADLLWFRDDFSSASLDQLMQRTDVPEPVAAPGLPADTQTVGAWFQTGGNVGGMRAWLRLRDARGEYFSLELGPLPEAGDWTFLGASLDAAPDAQTPLQIAAVLITDQPRVTPPDFVPIRVDAITAIDAEGEERVIDDLSRDHWTPITLRRGARDTIAIVDAPDAPSGGTVLEFRRAVATNPGRRGFIYADPGFCADECILPSVVSEGFAEREGLAAGDLFDLRLGDLWIRARMEGASRLFPSVSANAEAFVIADVGAIYHYASAASLEAQLEPNEIWLAGPQDSNDRAGTLTALGADPYGLSPVIDTQARIDAEGSDPLTAASGGGILTLAFVVVAGLVALAFAVALAIGAQKRRLEMAVLRTVGYGRMQILAGLALEYSVVMAVGAALGALLGTRVARVVLAYLEVDERGARVIPSFQVHTDWAWPLAGLAALLGVVVVGVALTWRYFARLRLSQEMRQTN